MKNFILIFDGEDQPMSIEAETLELAQTIIRNSITGVPSGMKISLREMSQEELIDRLNQLIGSKAETKSAAAKTLASYRSDKKAEISRENGKKGGRIYKYIILSGSDVLGRIESNRKDEAIQQVREMFRDYETSLLLTTKATPEQLEKADQGVLITPHTVII